MTEPRSCPRCYAPLRPSESPEGLCPKCLLAVAMGEDGLIRTATGEPVPAPPAIADLAPHFPQLEILSLVGRGGAGAVYRAIQRDLGRTVALKVLLLDPERDPTFGERFAREARAMASLTHPNIAGVYDAGRAGPYWYLLLEFVDGPNLRQLIQARDLPASEALDVVRQICAALEFAHGEGIVHRDIKPENVLVDPRGRVKLVDFGLAKLLRPELSSATLTRSAQAMGTWHYMAPEQLRRPLEVDHRADIYSLGVVLYELLTGEIPQGRYEPASHRAHTDRRLDAIVDRALEQDPARRYQQARGVREDVERVSSEPEVDAPRPSWRERHSARRERRSWLTDRDPARMRERGQGILYGCGCLVFAGLVALLGFAFLMVGKPERTEPATPVSGVVLPADVSPGARRVLEAIRPLKPVAPELIEAAEVAWLGFTALERANTRMVELESPSDFWFQVEVAPFPAELQRVKNRFLAAVPPENLSRATAALDGTTAFPSGAALRLIEVRPLEHDDERALAREGVAQWEVSPDWTPPPEAQALAPDLLVEESIALPWDLEELGYSRTIPVAALEQLLEAEQQYLELERSHMRTEAGRDGAAVVFVVEPFRERRAAVVERLTKWLKNMQIARPEFEVLMPFGWQDQPTRIWQVAAPGGAKVSLQLQGEAWFTSMAGGAAPYLMRFLQRAERAFGSAPFTSADVGLGSGAKAEALAAAARAWERYLAEEAPHRVTKASTDGSTLTKIAPFRTERSAVLDDLIQALATIDPGWSANGGSPLLLDELFEFGYEASEVEVRARPDGRFEVRTKRGEAERTQVLDELGWRYERFAPAATRSGTLVSSVDPERLGLPADLSAAARTALARAEARFGELLVPQREPRDLRAAGGSTSRAGWPRRPLPEKPSPRGLVSRVPAFAEARVTLLDELFAVLDSEVENVDRERVAALVAPLGERTELVHAGTWLDHFFLLARPLAEAEGDLRVIWGGAEIDPRFRAFFLATDSELELHELRGSLIRPAIDGVVDTEADLVYPSAGAEYLLSASSAAPTRERILAAEDAWDAYAGLLEEHRRTTAWSVDGEPFVQVDLESFEGPFEVWRAATLENIAGVELPALPGRYARAELWLGRSGVMRFEDASPGPVLDVLRASLPSAVELEELFAGARPLEFDVVDAVWPWRDIAPPASFASGVLDLLERVAALEAAHIDVVIARLGGGVELFVEPAREDAAELRSELAELVRAAEATDRPAEARRAVDPSVLLPFAGERGTIQVGWDGETPRIVAVRIGGEEIVEEAWPPGLERCLAPDLAERARLWCAPEELGFDRPLDPAAIWTVARARWEYTSQVSLRRRTIEPPQPVLPQPEGSRRQLRLEGPVVHLPEFSDERRRILDQLLLDLRALGEEPTDTELLELTLAPFGRRPVDLAISREGDRLTIWSEVRESGALELPEEDRIGLVYEGPPDDWRWFFWSL